MKDENNYEPFNYDKCMKLHGGECVTRDGRRAKIVYRSKTRSGRPLFAMVTNVDGEEEMEVYTQEGYWLSTGELSRFDLFLSPLRTYQVVWDADKKIFPTWEEATRVADGLNEDFGTDGFTVKEVY